MGRGFYRCLYQAKLSAKDSRSHAGSPAESPQLQRATATKEAAMYLACQSKCDKCASGVAPANQTKERSVHELFAEAFRNKSSICEFRACFLKEKHENSQKWAKFMNFSFWPFLWFGLPGRLLNVHLLEVFFLSLGRSFCLQLGHG